MSSLTYKPLPYRLGKITPFTFKRWGPSLAVWGIGAGLCATFASFTFHNFFEGLYATYLLSVTPLVKRGFLVKIPILGNYYADKTPDEDKPF